MEAFRLARSKYASDLSGIGASIRGARWNSAGVEMIYTAANRSLAMAEVAVHLTLATVPADFVMLTVYIPDNISLQKITESELPEEWNVFPYKSNTQQIGDRFIAQNDYCLLQVPSSVTNGDSNVLINPRHQEFSEIKIVDTARFPFDRRIFE